MTESGLQENWLPTIKTLISGQFTLKYQLCDFFQTDVKMEYDKL